MKPDVSSRTVSSRAPQRLVACGIIAGFLLPLVAPAFPERVQNPILIGGIALFLVCVGITVVHLTKDAQLKLRGVSPVIAIVIGALAVIGPVGWRYLGDGATARTPAVAAPLPPPATAPRHAPAAEPDVAPTQPGVASDSLTDLQRLNRMLEDVSGVLAQGTQAVSLTEFLPTLIPRIRKPALITSRLAAARTGLADLQLSLNRLRAENRSFGRQLDTVLGDTTPVTELAAALQRFSDSVQSMAGGAANEASNFESGLTLTPDLEAATDNTKRWIVDCQQRIADLRASAATTM